MAMFGHGIQKYYEHLLSRKTFHIPKEEGISEEDSIPEPVIVVPALICGIAKHSAKAVLIIEDIVKNHLYDVNIVSVIKQIEEYLWAKNFIDLLEFKFNKNIGTGEQLETYQELEKEFFVYYVEKLPLALDYGYKDKYSITKDECDFLFCLTLTHYYNEKKMDIPEPGDLGYLSDDKQLNVDYLIEQYTENQAVMKSIHRSWTSPNTYDKKFNSVAYNFYRLEMILGFDDCEWIETENDKDYIYSVVLKSNLKMFWDSFHKYVSKYVVSKLYQLNVIRDTRKRWLR